MTTRSAGRLPRDIHARERLRQAQQAEAHALAAVCSAQAQLAGTWRKRDVAVAAADVLVNKAERALAITHAHLVDISGLDRAAALLGIDRASLRKSVAAAASSEDGGVA